MGNNSTVADIYGNILVADNESLFIIAMSLSLFNLSSIMLSLCFLHTYLKKLHSIIKLILTILCGYNLICCTITIIILVYFRISSEQTITVCGLLQLTTITPHSVSALPTRLTGIRELECDFFYFFPLNI